MRSLSVNQYVGHTTEDPHRPIETADHRRQRLVPRRDHHPQPAPRQPCAPQIRLPAGDPSDRGPSPTAPTSPAQGSTADTPAVARPDSSPSPRPPPAGPCAPSRRTRAPRACRTRRQRGSCRSSARPTPRSWPGADRSTSPAAAAHRRRRAALVTQRDVMLDGVMRTTRQLGGRPERPRQIERFQNLHDLLVRLQLVPPGPLAWSGDRPVEPGGTPPAADPDEATNINEGRSTGHQWAEPVATSGQFRDRLRAGSHGRRQDSGTRTIFRTTILIDRCAEATAVGSPRTGSRRLVEPGPLPAIATANRCNR